MSHNSKLRETLDGNDSFMRGGHQIVSARTYDRKCPLWAKSDKEIQKLLLRAFPNLATTPAHRESSRRWVAVINLYFRLGYTRSQVAQEMGSTKAKVHSLIRSINRTQKGLRTDGSGLRTPRSPRMP